MAKKYSHLLIPALKDWYKIVSQKKSVKISRNFILAFWASVIIVYVIAGIALAYAVYGQKKTTSFVKSVTKIYLFPATSVNGQIVSVSSVLDQLIYAKSFSQITQQEIPADSDIINKIIDQKISDAIVREQVAKYKIGITRDEVNSAMKSIVEKNGGEEEVEKIINGYYQMSLDNFKNNFLYINLLKEKLDNEVLKQVKIAHILISDKKTADSTNSQINDGKITFEEAVTKFSEDSESKEKNGELDYTSKGKLPEEIEKEVFGKEKGTKIPNPIKTSFGYHIVRIIDVKGDVDKSINEWLDELKKEAKIKKYL
ncbi:MAG: Foldase protein PrsA [Berkelbacteria bacterium GW2011_GWA2_35_9]|uniref:Foldase protein PrsA n=1 Tax=Berkelbacteria bacterium GW2011_GWA2_35_9 TaxID=1618333 RepID=A0A0G0GAK3_9BACT|nr:MAG: Foldase protein PrsA [Berkelbacteria bacterium GW2011_GWA2_35_9]